MVRLFLRSPFWKPGSSGQTHSTRNPNQDRWERRSELGLGKQHSDFRGALEALGPTPEVEQGAFGLENANQKEPELLP